MEPARDRRVQTLFSAEEFDLLAEHAASTGKSLSSIIRQTVAEHLITELRRQHRIEAAEWLCSGGDEFPTMDWEQMESELSKGRFEGRR